MPHSARHKAFKVLKKTLASGQVDTGKSLLFRKLISDLETYFIHVDQTMQETEIPSLNRLSFLHTKVLWIRSGLLFALALGVLLQ